jgi:uncharacterized membrane protein YqhA
MAEIEIQEAACEECAETDAKQEAARRRAMRAHSIAGYTRFITAVPCIGLFIAAIALTVSTLISTVLTTIEAVQGHLSMHDMLVEYIEYADFFLLSVVLYIMCIGLYALFIDHDVVMPSWLEIDTLDDLKEKLIGVIGVVMGVYFLGRLIHGTDPFDLLLIGLGTAAVITALAYFVKHVISSHQK